MVILRSQNKITDFLMILAWASPFKPIGVIADDTDIFQLLIHHADLSDYYENMYDLHDHIKTDIVHLHTENKFRSRTHLWFTFSTCLERMRHHFKAIMTFSSGY